MSHAKKSSDGFLWGVTAKGGDDRRNSGEKLPPLILAARNFQENIRNRDMKAKESRDAALEGELSNLQTQMDSKMQDLQDLADLSEKTKPAAHILETVMGELEQRNLELTSLLKASEKSRTEMEDILKAQNNELTTLRANTVILKTLEEEVAALNDKKTQAHEDILQLESDVAEFKRSENAFNKKLEESEQEREAMQIEHASQLLDVSTKLRMAEEELLEKELEIERAEQAMKELFGKCNQLGSSNEDIKGELAQSLDSGKHLLDVNTKLQFCKQYLEQQVDQLVKELKSSRGTVEQLKLEIANISREKHSAEKQVKLLQQTEVHYETDVKNLKETIDNLEKQLQAYESGSVKSAVCLNEINKEKESHEETRIAMDKKVRSLDEHIKQQNEEIKNQQINGRKLKNDIIQMQSKLEYYQQNFIERAELQKIKTDLEIKFKLDMNTQLQRIGNMYEQEQAELIESMQKSMQYRRAVHNEFDGELNARRSHR